MMTCLPKCFEPVGQFRITHSARQVPGAGAPARTAVPSVRNQDGHHAADRKYRPKSRTPPYCPFVFQSDGVFSGPAWLFIIQRKLTSLLIDKFLPNSFRSCIGRCVYMHSHLEGYNPQEDHQNRNNRKPFRYRSRTQ